MGWKFAGGGEPLWKSLGLMGCGGISACGSPGDCPRAQRAPRGTACNINSYAGGPVLRKNGI